jgi:hypothetical protein
MFGGYKSIPVGYITQRLDADANVVFFFTYRKHAEPFFVWKTKRAAKKDKKEKYGS